MNIVYIALPVSPQTGINGYSLVDGQVFGGNLREKFMVGHTQGVFRKSVPEQGEVE